MSSVVVVFDAESHSADAIQRAAYRFCDRFSVELIRRDTDYACTLFFEDETADHDSLAADFRIEVVDQVLRERVRIETEATRNLILALAFSNTNFSSE